MDSPSADARDYPLSERLFLRAVLALAHDHGWLAFHLYDSRKSTGHGFPDLVMVRSGRLVFAELKAESGSLRPLQSVWLRLLSQVPGVMVAVWKPSNWPEIVALLSPAVRSRTVPAAACLSL